MDMVVAALKHTPPYLRRFLQYTASGILVSIMSMSSYFPSCTSRSICGNKKMRPSWILYILIFIPGYQSGWCRGSDGAVLSRSQQWKSGRVKWVSIMLVLVVSTHGTKTPHNFAPYSRPQDVRTSMSPVGQIYGTKQ